MVERICNTCGISFKPKNYNQKFCCDSCRDEHHNDFISKAVAAYRKMLAE